MTYTYHAFGPLRSQGSTLSTSFRFAGEQYDLKARAQGSFGLTGTNGLYYLRARYYDPTIGRFLTRDPLPGSVQNPQSLNPYPYVQNNPVNRVDPSGKFSEAGVGPTVLLASLLDANSCIGATFRGMVGAGFLALAISLLNPPATGSIAILAAQFPPYSAFVIGAMRQVGQLEFGELSHSRL